jgi:hypothetical protein
MWFREVIELHVCMALANATCWADASSTELYWRTLTAIALVDVPSYVMDA